MQAWVLTAVGVAVAMLGWAGTVRLRRRIRVDRHELDDLRRLYRQDNPRGPGLEPPDPRPAAHRAGAVLAVRGP